MSTPATIPCLLYFAALFLTVATLWILLYADPNERSPRDFFVLSYAVCHADLLRAGCHNLRQHRCGTRLADGVALAAILRVGSGCGSYLYRPISVAVVAMAQTTSPSKMDTAMTRRIAANTAKLPELLRKP